METLNVKEFIEKLKSNSLKQRTCIKGIVKNSDKDSEVLFKRKGDSAWIALPSSLIETVKVIKTFIKENETYAAAKLRLKTPTTIEGKTLFELLSSMEKSCSDKSMGEHNHFGMDRKTEHSDHTCQCGCHHQPDCQCGCSNERICGCGCHHQPDCRCGCNK
jgi:hypothetical protein